MSVEVGADIADGRDERDGRDLRASRIRTRRRHEMRVVQLA
jgi:hypothetical protein